MDASDHLSRLSADIERVLELPAEVDDLPVPNCPGWAVRDLVEHTAGVFAFASRNLAADPGSDLVMDGSVPDGFEGRELFERCASELLEILTVVDPSEHRPNWAGQPSAFFYFRRMAQEMAVHRWDAQSAAGEPDPIPTAQAVDGIDELFDVFLVPFARSRGVAGTGESVHLHATDAGEGGEWTATFGADGIELDRIHGKAQMAAKGTASDLMLFTWNRRPVDLEVFGEPELLSWWPEKISI